MKLLEKRLRAKCYLSLDSIPIYNWWRISEVYDLGYLFPIYKKTNPIQNSILIKIWKEIQDEFIKTFGHGEHNTRKMELELQIARMTCVYRSENDTSLDLYIKIAKYELDVLNNKNHETNFFMFKSEMEDILKFAIDIKKISVKEFYSYISLIEKKAERGRK